jgi:hypothetical protein
VSKKFADLDLLDGDPLADINNTKRITAAIVNGRLVDAAERNKVLDAADTRRSSTSVRYYGLIAKDITRLGFLDEPVRVVP